MSIRHSMRPEALMAAERIRAYCKVDMTNSDSDESTTSPSPSSPPSPPSPSSPPSHPSSDHNLFHPEEKNYKYTTNVIRYLIDECNKADFEDQRRQIVEKMFDHLNKNPSILIYEPKFRNSVINKMKEFETHINTRIASYNKSKYTKMLTLIRITMHENVRNSVMRLELYKHFEAINTILAEYEPWSKSTPLMKQIGELYNTLETIKKYPFYVANVEHTS